MTIRSLLPRYYRVAVVIACTVVAAVAGSAADSPALFLNGTLYDLGLAVHGARMGADDAPVIVIAMDRESLASAELAGTPRALFGPYWAKLIDGLMTAGASAIGFDLIFGYSAAHFPFLTQDYDRSFLDALSRYRDRIVVARSGTQPVASPYAAALYAAGDRGPDPSAVAFSEIAAASDGIVRSVGGSIPVEGGGRVPTFAERLVESMGHAMPSQSFLLAPRRPLEAIPAFSMISVLRCLETNPDGLRPIFKGKLVVVGDALAEEDRVRGPDRFLSWPNPRARVDLPGCTLARSELSDPQRETLPGVFVHAAAAEASLDGNIVREAPVALRAALSGLAGAGGALAGVALMPWWAAAIATVSSAGIFLAAASLVAIGLWWPAGTPMAALWGCGVLAYVVRFMIEEPRRRRLQAAFGHYLAPSLVDRLLEDTRELHLGGEMHELTVMFADLSGFTAFSETVDPETLMAVTNKYLALIAAAVESTGGYVDKFIGDAVMAIWGAPLPLAAHAEAAATAALRAQASVSREKSLDEARKMHGYSVKIGLNSGPGVVGNVGTSRRFNFTAVGETVNVAARLEIVAADYGCQIVVGPQTAEMISERCLLCELDCVQLKGKREPIAVHELICWRAEAATADRDYVRQYQMALAHYRQAEFAAALAIWRSLAHPQRSGLTPSRVMAQRCEYLLAHPPQSWTGVWRPASH